MEHEERGDDSTAVFEYARCDEIIEGGWVCRDCGACNAPWLSSCACCEGDK